ncbi:preprotein translocase subunit SecB [Weissella uvarum]|uniref:protein-export chaperone SecB n=1 Tax=Lactobacillaceae TaxID=33958 RepID=UPI001961944F|nr:MULTISPECIES: protein-export chaperone SecB [Lactobacillaceae]MBM7617267.1 preprotein translocase subunit SecB [Weissella uvarum]MCM0595228.1 protein-export chaperone SecB [Weissella uvarum]MCM0601464.1 protein-export chaperone SecB [Periweissella ghanensis]
MSISESSFQFNNPSITCLTFKINDDFDENEFDGFDKVKFRRKINRDGDTHANVSLEVKMDGAKAPFNLELTMESDFVWNEKLNVKNADGEEQVEIFLKYTAPSLLLSYMRPVVAYITNSSKFPVYNMPFLDFTTLEESSDVESNH